MKRRIDSIVIAIMLITLIASCTSRDIMSFKDVRYISETDWPEVISLTDYQVLPLPFPAAKDFIFLDDSLAVFSTDDGDGFYKICRVEDFSLVNTFIRKGRGPGEMPVPEFAGNFSISKKGRNVIADFDGGNGKWITFDITASLTKGVPVISLQDCPDNLTLSALRLDEEYFFFKELDRNSKCQRRYLYHDGKEETTKAIEILNSVVPKVENDGYSFNIISTITRYDSEHEMFVEASLFLNTVHIYSRDGSFSRTICLGRKLDNPKRIGTLLNTKRYATDIIIGDPQDPTVGFEVLCSGNGSAETPSYILCFSWDGNPVRKIILSQEATYFQKTKAAIYTLDSEDDQLIRYTIELPEV